MNCAGPKTNFGAVATPLSDLEEIGTAGHPGSTMEALARDYAGRCGWPITGGPWCHVHLDELVKAFLAFAKEAGSLALPAEEIAVLRHAGMSCLGPDRHGRYQIRVAFTNEADFIAVRTALDRSA